MEGPKDLCPGEIFMQLQKNIYLRVQLESNRYLRHLGINDRL